MKHLSIIVLFSFFFCGTVMAQDQVNVVLITDTANDPDRFLEGQIESELKGLLASRYEFTIQSKDVAGVTNFDTWMQEIYESEADFVIGTSFQACLLLGQLTTFEKPTILSVVLDRELQQIPLTSEGTSGKTNLNYIQSPLDFIRDFEVLYSIKPYSHLAIVAAGTIADLDFNISTFIEKALDDREATYQIYQLEENLPDQISVISKEADAAFLFPILDHEMDGLTTRTLAAFAESGIPVFSVLSNPSLEQGAYAAFETDGNLNRIPRRVALNVVKILEGQAAADLPVAMDHFTDNLVLNMETVRTTGHYPSWDLMSESILMNISTPGKNARTLNLKAAILEGLDNNLGLQMAQKGVRISEKEVAIAKSNYLPQLDVSATSLLLDEATVLSSFGARGYLNFSAKANFSQLILSEPALANVAIQKLLLESENQYLRQNELDVIQDVADAYLGILQTNELVRLRNENVNVTRTNYDIARAKEQVGYGGTNDVYRFESELALNNVELNNAQAQLESTRYNLNMLLNRPIKEAFSLEDINMSDNLLFVTNATLNRLIENPGDIAVFADFMVQEAFNNLPELKQIEAALMAQERNLLSQDRAFYLPSVVMAAEYDMAIDQFGYPEGVMPVDVAGTYNAAVVVQLPIFQGNSRRHRREQTEVEILQLKDQEADLRNKLELQIRSEIQLAGASFSNLGLSKKAVEAARHNFAIAQDAYKEGILNITSFIDAQNALLQTEINAINAEYTFISDFLDVERSIGNFHFLALPQDQQAFFQRFIQFITNRE